MQLEMYNLIENNCTTKSVDALIHGGTKLKFLIQKIQFTDGKSMPFIKTEPIYSPRDLKDFLNVFITIEQPKLIRNIRV